MYTLAWRRLWTNVHWLKRIHVMAFLMCAHSHYLPWCANTCMGTPYLMIIFTLCQCVHSFRVRAVTIDACVCLLHCTSPCAHPMCIMAVKAIALANVFASWMCISMHLTLKLRETHGCIDSTVATDALVLKHQAISIPAQCWLNIHCTEPFSYKNIPLMVNNIRK